LAQRYNGYNNGEISMSVREAARLLHIAKDTATKAFRELEHKGFIECNQCGSFNWKAGKATTWILTEHAFDDELPSKEFASWRPEKLEDGPNPETRCPSIGTASSDFHANRLLDVLYLGLSPPFCAGPRSQSAAHI
jgi:DNA-binding transcriptional MocR family regulator